MNLTKQIFNYFKLSKEDKNIISNELNLNNIHRLIYLSIFAVTVSTIYIIIFLKGLDSVSGIEYQWKRGLVFSHLFTVFAFSIIGIVSYLIKKKYIQTKNFNSILIKSTHFIILFLGGLIATIDQLVTNAITPFLIACTIASLILIVRPTITFIFYTTAYLFFSYTIEFTQGVDSILLSNRVNALTAVAIGFGLSLILWRVTMDNYRQNRLIIKQKNELENNYKQSLSFSEKLRNSNMTKDKFFSIIAHDLRGPLSGIISLVRLINIKTQSNKLPDETQVNIIEELQKASENTFNLLENLLTWAQNQQGEINFNPDVVDLKKLLHEINNLLLNQLRNKNITLKIDILPETHLFADKNMLKTVLRNLLSNALKFTNEYGLIKISYFQTDENHLISVEDNGVGISKEEVSKLFEIGKKTGSTGTKGEKGSGLGLILCKDFIEKHNGQIWVKSEAGKGSKFSFTLPRIKNS